MSIHGVDRLQPFTLDELNFLRSRSFSFVARYLKNLTPDEVAATLSRRIGLLPISEESGHGPWTYDIGKAQATTDRGRALALGCPLGSPIPFAIDDGGPAGPELVDYFNGVFDGLGGAYLAGVYGKYDVVKFARENFPALGFFWQTYAWSGGLFYIAADVVQHANGVSLRAGMPPVDLDIAREEIPWRIA